MRKFEGWTEDDFKLAVDTYLDLCEWLHEHAEQIPPQVMEDINDMVYKYLEP